MRNGTHASQLKRALPRTERRLGRLEDTQFLTGLGLTAAQIAVRLGVTKRTVERYRHDLRNGFDSTGPL